MVVSKNTSSCSRYAQNTRKHTQERSLTDRRTRRNPHGSVEAINSALRQKQNVPVTSIIRGAGKVPENDPSGTMQGKQDFIVSGRWLRIRLYGPTFKSGRRTQQSVNTFSTARHVISAPSWEGISSHLFKKTYILTVVGQFSARLSERSIRAPWILLAITPVVFYSDNLTGKKKKKAK